MPLPPAPLPPWRGRRLLKRWRYVGVYGPEVMLCAGRARIGPAGQAWWAVLDRREGRLHERTRLHGRGGHVELPPGRVRVRDGDAAIELELADGAVQGIEVVTFDPGGYAWTAKRVPNARGEVRVAGRSWSIDGPALVDDSAGYHPRHTSWLWSAGTGTARDGRAVAWNLVEGVHDSTCDSERTVWVDGRPAEVGPVRFAPDLSAVRFAEGAELRFAAEATRRRDDNLLVFRSVYEQPFGAFSGTLPSGLELAEGFGVMERHRAVW